MGQTTRYRCLFEGKYKTTHGYAGGLATHIYFHCSAATHVAKRLLHHFGAAVRLAKTHTPLVLDVGCGGGMQDLAQAGKVVGIDISFSSLVSALSVYGMCAVVDLSGGFPFSDKSFDIVVCSEVMGHILPEDKPNVYREVNRILKPGGRAIFSIETAGSNWLTRKLRRRDMYQQFWVDYHGHIGLRSPQETIEEIDRYLQLVHYEKSCTWGYPVDIFLIFSERYPLLRKLERDCIRRSLNMLLYPWYMFALIFSRLDSAIDIIVVATKRPP